MHKCTSEISVLWRTKCKGITVAQCPQLWKPVFYEPTLAVRTRRLVVVIDYSLSCIFLTALSLLVFLSFVLMVLLPWNFKDRVRKGLQLKCQHFISHDIKRALQEESQKGTSPARNSSSSDTTPLKITRAHKRDMTFWVT